MLKAYPKRGELIIIVEGFDNKGRNRASGQGYFAKKVYLRKSIIAQFHTCFFLFN